MTEYACSSVPVTSVKLSKKNKKKKSAAGDGMPSESVAVRSTNKSTIDTPQQFIKPLDMGRLSVSQEGTEKKTKKKKNKNNTGSLIGIERGIAQSSKDGEGEDATESIDSGCIADVSPTDVAELTDWPQVEGVILEESHFVSSLLNWLPASQEGEGEDEEGEKSAEKGNTGNKKTAGPRNDLENVRANLRKQLEALKQSRKNKPWDGESKRKETKLTKKLSSINKQCAKKAMNINRGLFTKDLLADSMDINSLTKITPTKSSIKKNKNQNQPQKPIYNKYGELVFSKFDFTENSMEAFEDPKPNDLKQKLHKALKEKEKAKQLQQRGLTSAAAEMVEQRAWASALQKAEGVKVRDDIDMLKRSIKKKDSRKKASQKKWEGRLKNLDQKKNEREEKRNKNLGARKDAKLKKKIGKMKKKGHIVPGF